MLPGQKITEPPQRRVAEPHPGAQRIVEEDDPIMEPAESPIPEAAEVVEVDEVDATVVDTDDNM